VKEWLICPRNKCGMGVASIKNRFERLQISKRDALKNSPNENIRDLWSDSTLKNVRTDSLLIDNGRKKAKQILIKAQGEEASNHLLGLPCQGQSIKMVTEQIPNKYIDLWANLNGTLPGFLFNFVRKAFQSQLPTKANLLRWGRSSSNLCPLCNAVQSNKHVLSNCSNIAVLRRYTERHDKILSILATWFQSKLDKQCCIFADLPGFQQTSGLFNSIRPDLVLKRGNKICAIELTICHETNLISSKTYKEAKYQNIDNLKSESIKNCTVSLATCEISVLGFVQFDNASLNDFKIPSLDENLLNIISRSVIQSSFDIYAHRDSII
jgi:hypothetical protein